MADECTHASNLYPALQRSLQNPENHSPEKNGVHPSQELHGTYKLTQFLSCSPATKQERSLVQIFQGLN